MYKVYDRWPEIALESFESDQDFVDFNGVDHIVFAGMGGSGAISDIFSSILSKTEIHVDVVKGYHLPKTANSNSLVIATSISRNTSETLSILKQAKDKGCKIIAFSNGGKMKDFCDNNKIEYRFIEMYHSPRASFTLFLYSMLKVLSPILPIQEKDIIESIKFLKILNKEINSENLTDSNPALNLAYWIDEIPIIYYPWGLHAAAIRFKNSIQENAKQHAIIEDVVESSHNGIVSWSQNKSKVKPILLRGKDDYFKTQERWGIFKKYFTENKIEFKEINSIDGGILSKLIHFIYFLDYTTIYLSIILGIDPTPVDAIDFVKKRL